MIEAGTLTVSYLYCACNIHNKNTEILPRVRLFKGICRLREGLEKKLHLYAVIDLVADYQYYLIVGRA
jgi:hypothetical protein